MDLATAGKQRVLAMSAPPWNPGLSLSLLERGTTVGSAAGRGRVGGRRAELSAPWQVAAGLALCRMDFQLAWWRAAASAGVAASGAVPSQCLYSTRGGLKDSRCEIQGAERRRGSRRDARLPTVPFVGVESCGEVLHRNPITAIVQPLCERRRENAVTNSRLPPPFLA